jgi:peptidyl-prolyl cis-trans isomerase A (cyclophilin A)
LGGGGGGGGKTPPPPPPPPPAAFSCTASPPPPAPAAGALPPQVTFTVNNGAGVSGDLVITLDPARSPITVANFLTYVNSGFYNCTVVHRNASSPAPFVLQGGGYAGPVAVGTTLPTLKTPNANILLEDNNGRSNTRLTVAMARTSVPDSANSQWFINLAANTFLDRTATARGYAVFGEVTTGEALVTAMTGAPCTSWAAFFGGGSTDCFPNPNLYITSARQTR